VRWPVERERGRKKGDRRLEQKADEKRGSLGRDSKFSVSDERRQRSLALENEIVARTLSRCRHEASL
jgi:hypothetical protein